MENAEMAEGTIKKLIAKGFGFINTGGDKDLFFHSSAVQGVRFEECKSAKKSPTRKARARKAPRRERHADLAPQVNAWEQVAEPAWAQVLEAASS